MLTHIPKAGAGLQQWRQWLAVRTVVEVVEDNDVLDALGPTCLVDLVHSLGLAPALGVGLRLPTVALALQMIQHQQESKSAWKGQLELRAASAEDDLAVAFIVHMTVDRRNLDRVPSEQSDIDAALIIAGSGASRRVFEAARAQQQRKLTGCDPRFWSAPVPPLAAGGPYAREGRRQVSLPSPPIRPCRSVQQR